MITIEDIESTWALLEGADLESRELRVREVDELTTPHGRPMFALDDLQRRHLLIPTRPTPKIHEDKQSAGVHIAVHRLIDKGQPHLFVDFVCRKPHLNRLFTVVVHEVVTLLLTSDASRPDLLCQQVLSRWRELLEKEPAGYPDIQTLTGLFGELWHLREVIRRSPDGLTCWVGPTGARHDLVSRRASLEVKASLVRHGRFFTINGHDQLEPPTGGTLYLAAMKLEQVQSEGEAISDLIASITALGGDRHLLFTLLAKAGVTPDAVELCSDVHFRIIENRLYQVAKGFPRITSDSFKGGSLPNGVLTLSYQIDLSSEPPLPLNESDSAAVYSLLALETVP